MNILIIGGTRQIGQSLTRQLLAHDHRVTVLNRGITPDTLPDRVARLVCDRTNHQQLRRALAGRSFDVVIDNVLFNGAEAESIVEILRGNVGHYIMISTGQVYLVRDGIERPFREDDYPGELIPRPVPNTYDDEEWSYGYHKRQAEDTLAAAWSMHRFPYTSLRLPMINGAKDKFNRLYGYILRIQDGGPILVPTEPTHPLRHVYVEDVVQAILRLIDGATPQGKAYNISQDEALTIDEFIALLSDLMDRPTPPIVRVERDLLEANGFLPDCSPFSDRWMSELDNCLSKTELGMVYTPVREYLATLVQAYRAHPPALPASYRRRNAERALIPS